MDQSAELPKPERVVATTKEDLPPLKEGFCRLVHITNPRMVDRIRNISVFLTKLYQTR